VRHVDVNDGNGPPRLADAGTRHEIGPECRAQVIDAQVDGGHSVAQDSDEREVTGDVDQASNHAAVVLAGARRTLDGG
jgi:hypothetical protein